MDTDSAAHSIALLQLSDIHFLDSTHPILERAESIVAAIRSLVMSTSKLFLVVPGDVAFAGKAAEYALADSFFRDLIERLASELPGTKIDVVFAPGNHDCDLTQPVDLRDYQFLKPRLAAIDPTGAIVQSCLSVQDQFFVFASQFGQIQGTQSEKLAKRLEFFTPSHKIAFTVYNTAWLSQIREKPGQLYVPRSVFISPEAPADIEIAIIHHPYNWLDPENMLEFRAHLETMADIVLSGHQHHAADHRLEALTGAGNYLIEAMAMYDTRADRNGFNVIFLAPASGEWQLNGFVWDQKRYVPSAQASWLPFRRNKALEEQGYINATKFKEYLSDPGVAFTHGRKAQVFLQDIFVYPELQQRDLQRKIEAGRPSKITIRSKDVPEWIYDSKKILISGDDQSGRTALAKTIYLDLRRRFDVIPLLLDRSLLEMLRTHSAKEVLSKAYEDQYGKAQREAFFQLPSSRRALIIDDFHRSSLGAAYKAKLITTLEGTFDIMVVFVDPVFDVDVLTAGVNVSLFGPYRQYRIEEMGHQLRGKLISQWVSMGADNWSDSADAFQELVEKENVIESLLSRRMLPSHPIIILGMLQFLEANKNPHIQSGSYGELYQQLITDRLALIAKKPSDIGTWYTLLARLAFTMYGAETRTVTRQQFRNTYNDYYAEFKIHFDVDTLLNRFVNAQILNETDGNIGFKYRDFYHFFVARYFHDNIQDPAEQASIRLRLQEMADRVYFDEYAGILVFYLYLAKDQQLIQLLLDNGKKVYADYKPCDLEVDTEFLNRMYIAPPGVVTLPSSDITANRDSYRARMDELEKESPAPNEGEKVPYSDDLSDFIKINIAMKTMYILGQVLRAFPGAIKQELKTKIATECYLLGLRVLNFVARAVETHSDELRSFFAMIIKERRANIKAWEIPSSAEEVILNLMESWAFGMIKKISESVGLSELEVTYDEVISSMVDALSIRLIDLSIRLDHQHQFPQEQVQSIYNSTRKSIFTRSILRDLVVHYFSLFRSTPTIKNKYCKMLDIKLPSTPALQGFTKPD